MEHGVARFLSHVVTCYSDMALNDEPQLAAIELRKAVDIICASYETEKYNEIIKTKLDDLSTIEKCHKLLNTIYEIYTEVIHERRRQLITDNKNERFTWRQTC